MDNMLEDLIKRKEKCRWRENSIAGDLCTNKDEFECYFLSDNSYLISTHKICKCDYMHFKMAYESERGKR